MACSTVRSIMVDKAAVAPIPTIARLVSKQTSSSTTATTAIPRLVIPSSTASTSSESLLSLFTATTPQPDDLRAPAPVFNSSVVSGTTSTTRPISANASTTTTTKASSTSVPTAPRPRFIPRNRRSLMSSGGDSSNWAILFPGTISHIPSHCFFLYTRKLPAGCRLLLLLLFVAQENDKNKSDGSYEKTQRENPNDEKRKLWGRVGLGEWFSKLADDVVTLLSVIIDIIDRTGGLERLFFLFLGFCLGDEHEGREGT
ncbi:MAG: hypothetical protein J3R72DRAFT_258177 [Linnemannia gamsii]|nr:MAG: hypothetical protein J3R72DRAFT_258177 [Linnemannia gamsii]